MSDQPLRRNRMSYLPAGSPRGIQTRRAAEFAIQCNKQTQRRLMPLSTVTQPPILTHASVPATATKPAPNCWQDFFDRAASWCFAVVRGGDHCGALGLVSVCAAAFGAATPMSRTMSSAEAAASRNPGRDDVIRFDARLRSPAKFSPSVPRQCSTYSMSVHFRAVVKSLRGGFSLHSQLRRPCLAGSRLVFDAPFRVRYSRKLAWNRPAQELEEFPGRVAEAD